MTNYMEDFQEELEQIYVERIRYLDINGRRYSCRAHDPYGAWHIEEVDMKLPKELTSQRFTTIENAWDACKAYDNANKAKLDDKQEKKAKKTAKTLEL